MLFLRRPTAEAIRAFLAAQARLDLTYSAVGATATNPPAGYVVDHTRIKLGEGEKVFAAAKAALERWQQFRLGWVEACPEDTPIKEGQVVAILARSIGLWWLNACRIVVRRGRGRAGEALRLRLRHAAGPCRERGGAIPGRVGPGRRQRVVRHPGLLPASTFPGTARLPVGAADAEAVRSGVGCGHAPGGKCGGLTMTRLRL